MLSRSCIATRSSAPSVRAACRATRPAVLCLASPRVVPTQQLSHPAANQELLDKLNETLSGVTHKTCKATAKAVKVVHVSRARLAHRKLDNRPRCTGLDMDIAWEAVPVHAQQQAAEPVQGLARVRLTTVGGDKVVVSDIQVMQQDQAEGVPCMPSAQPAAPEVLLAVSSMDSVIMEHLNDFMWEMEQSKDFPLASFECDEDDEEEPYFVSDYSLELEEAPGTGVEAEVPSGQAPTPTNPTNPVVLTAEQLLQHGAALLQQSSGPLPAPA